LPADAASLTPPNRSGITSSTITNYGDTDVTIYLAGHDVLCRSDRVRVHPPFASAIGLWHRRLADVRSANRTFVDYTNAIIGRRSIFISGRKWLCHRRLPIGTDFN